ncbi:MAG: hypothetical protein PVF29_10110 [Desulfobacterales bacterium]|jgi:hypothetical protein
MQKQTEKKPNYSAAGIAIKILLTQNTILSEPHDIAASLDDGYRDLPGGSRL